MSSLRTHVWQGPAISHIQQPWQHHRLRQSLYPALQSLTVHNAAGCCEPPTQFGQELLSTFGMQIGEIALIPATGGLFTVELTYLPPAEEGKTAEATKVLLWDRKAEGGFPETKVLKQKVRDCIDPSRDLGHSDKHGKKKEQKAVESNKAAEEQKTGEENKGAEKETVVHDNKGEKEEIVQEKTIENAVEKERAVKGVEQEENNGVELKRNPDGTICEDCR